MLAFRWNWTLMRWGCPPSDCQYVSGEPSRSWSTPLPGFAVESDQTASSPISRLLESVLRCGAPVRGALSTWAAMPACFGVSRAWGVALSLMR